MPSPDDLRIITGHAFSRGFDGHCSFYYDGSHAVRCGYPKEQHGIPNSARHTVMPVDEQEDLADNTAFIPVWLDPQFPSVEDQIAAIINSSPPMLGDLRSLAEHQVEHNRIVAEQQEALRLAEIVQQERDARKPPHLVRFERQTETMRKYAQHESVSRVALAIELLAWYNYTVEGLEPEDVIRVTEGVADLLPDLYRDHD